MIRTWTVVSVAWLALAFAIGRPDHDLAEYANPAIAITLPDLTLLKLPTGMDETAAIEALLRYIDEHPTAVADPLSQHPSAQESGGQLPPCSDGSRECKPWERLWFSPDMQPPPPGFVLDLPEAVQPLRMALQAGLLSPTDLDSIYLRYYSDMPRAEFNRRVQAAIAEEVRWTEPGALAELVRQERARHSQVALGNLWEAAALMIVPPIALLMVGGAVYWAVRGFGRA